jgi:protein-disulfide isomerase
MHDVPDLRRQRRWQLGGLLVALLAAAAVALAVGATHAPPALRAGAPVPGAAAATTLLRGIPQHGLTLGNGRAPVTLIEFGDLQCPTCAEFVRDALPTLVAREVRTGRLQIGFRPLDFIGADSVRGARMALAVGQQNRLWQFLDLFYANQRDENSGYVSNPFVTALSDAIPGVNTAAALNGRDSAAVDGALADAAAEAHRRHVRVTPSFLIGRTGGALRALANVDPNSAASFTAPIERLAGGTSAGR